MTQLATPPAVSSMRFRIIQVGTRTGSFGHTDHIMVSETGLVWLAPRIRSSHHPLAWLKGDIINVPSVDGRPQFSRLGTECDRQLDSITDPKKLAYIWAAEFMGKEAEKRAEGEKKRQRFLRNNKPTVADKAAIASLSTDGVVYGQEKGRPACYAIPLKRRDRIIHEFKMNFRHRGGDRGYDNKRWLFVFDVKLHGLDLRFDSLLKAYRDCGEVDENLFTEAYIAACREKYNEKYSKGAYDLEEMAIEDARRQIREEVRVGGRWETMVSDSYNATWSGRQVNVELAFYGRSGGYLVATKFNGHELTADLNFEDISDVDIRIMYEWLVMLRHDFTQEKAVENVQFQAASIFFKNQCSDVV